ncbi:MAG: P-loop NTPase [Planctomycetes bacterium]|nr:P-loop NTPase [Planctomycetota bacterium]
MIDPRAAIIGERLAGVRRIVAVTGGKGGIGKSLVSCLFATVAAERGLRTGLFDLDLTSPTDHVILGAPMGFPSEEHGIDPAMCDGVRLMSIAMFSGSTPAPLRGAALTGALLELLAITRWGELDLLVLDMPPGLGDTALDAMRYLPRCEYLVVSTPSIVVRETVRRMVQLLGERHASILGLVENFQSGDVAPSHELAAEFQLRWLPGVPYDKSLEAAIGDVAGLRRTDAAKAVGRIVDELG